MRFQAVLGLIGVWRNNQTLVSCLLSKNLKLRFGGVKDRSWLGILLSQLNPIIIIAVYALVSGGILKVRVENFLVFLAVGHLHWSLFTSVISVACNSVKKEASLIKVVKFPYSILVLVDVLDQLFEIVITICLLLILLPVLGGSYWLGTLLYPVAFALQVLFMLGWAAAFSALTPFFNDLIRLQALGIRLLFWFTPVIYSASMVPERFRNLFLYLNPMALFLSIYRDLLSFERWPPLIHWGGLTGWTLLSFIGGWLIFTHLESRIPEEL